MLGCIQPMSSPMMKRMLGFCCCCAAAGVLAGPDSEIDISVVAPSSAAQERLCQPAARLHSTFPVPDGFSLGTKLTMASLSSLLGTGGFSPDASKAQVTRGCVDRLRMARSRPVASAVVRRAQMRTAFDDLLWNLDVGRSGVVAAILAPTARVLRDAAGFWCIGLVPRRVP